MTTRFILIVLLFYVIYYLTQIGYDMFFAKEKADPNEEDKEEFSLAEMDDNTVKNVGFEEVEQMTTSTSVQIDEVDLFSSAPNPDEDATEDPSQHLEVLKRKFEEEENLDNPDTTDTADENTGGLTAEESPAPLDKMAIFKMQAARFKDLLNMAETNVQVVNEGDVKLYKL
nr:hypothetical protein [uncultured Capnocytophaga sp.]